MIFQQLFDDETSTFTYLLADPETRRAVLIDPVLENTDAYGDLLARLDLTLVYTLETHVHADHITAGAALRERFGSQTVVHERGGARSVDVEVADGDVLRVDALEIEVLYTPGHTAGDVSYRVGDRVFTGDTLFIGGCGRTDFQQGSAERLYDSVHGKLFTLPDTTLMYPGHDYNGRTVSTIGWERAHNARLGRNRSRESFAEIMGNLNLAHPKRIARAVPANLSCGVVPSIDEALARSSTEASGFRDLGPWGAAIHKTDLRVVDVREVPEFDGPLGHIDGAELVPLGTVSKAAAGWGRDERLLVVCRSGGRSSRAAAQLTAMGFGKVYNLSGGMMDWNKAALPVAR